MKSRFFFGIFIVLFCGLAFAEYYFSQNYKKDLPEGINNVGKWAVQLQDADLDLVSISSFDLVVIDHSKTGTSDSKYTKEEIEKIKESGKIPIAYLSIGEAEDYRSYWQEGWKINSPTWLGKENLDWEGNYKVKYWEKKWREIILSRLDEIIEQGFSGVYLDLVDSFEYWSDSDNGENSHIKKVKAARDMISFVEGIAKHSRSQKENFYIIPQNAENILHYDTDGSYVETISGIGVESLFYKGTKAASLQEIKKRTNYLDKITGAGKPVFLVEYVDDGSGYFGKNKERIDDFRKKASDKKYIPYVAREDFKLDELNVLSEPRNIFSGNDRILPPEKGCYLGVFPGWGENEDSVDSLHLKLFENLSGKGVVVSPFSNFWGENYASSSQLNQISSYGAVPLLRLMPWGKPYFDKPGFQPDYSLQKIIDGNFDDLILKWAREIQEFKNPVMVAFAVEMNGNWFPWSGKFQGGGVKNKFGDSKKADGPERYIKAYRHIVKIFRQEKVNNAIWVFHASDQSYPDQKWNSIKNYYPGDKYVDWVGVSVYGSQYKDEDWKSFEKLMDPVYKTITKNFPQKPLMLAEWGVGEYPKKGDKASWYKEALEKMSAKYKKIKIAIIYSEEWENGDGSFTDLRINSSKEALEAYRAGIDSDYFIGDIGKNLSD